MHVENTLSDSGVLAVRCHANSLHLVRPILRAGELKMRL